MSSHNHAFCFLYLREYRSANCDFIFKQKVTRNLAFWGLWNCCTHFMEHQPAFQRLKLEERDKMELWAMALQESIQNNEPSNLALEILLETGENPMIQVDVKGEIIDFKNIPSSYAIGDSMRLYRYLTKIKKENAPIPIRYQPPGALKPLVDQRLYYGDSATLKNYSTTPWPCF